MSAPTYTIFAGVNGAGKTSLYRILNQYEDLGERVNIDEIVGGNAGVYNGSTITYNAGTADEYKVTLPTHASGKIGAIGTVFGGGNAAPVIGNTNVNIGTQESVTYVSGDKSTNPVVGVDIREDVFGGGLGSTATVSGNTNVVVGK